MPVNWSQERQQFVVAYDVTCDHDNPPYGLVYRPQLSNVNCGELQHPNHVDADDVDWSIECDEFVAGWKRLSDVYKKKLPCGAYSDDTFKIIASEVQALNDRPKPAHEGQKCIVEIGVNQKDKGWETFTSTILSTKDDSITYVGIDLNDKSYMCDVDRRVYTIRANSFEQERIRHLLRRLDVTTIDILFIDGYHSVNVAINDWQYADLLSDDGVVLLHDVNAHPGPRVLLDAIDRAQFNVMHALCNAPEHGMGIIRRIQTRIEPPKYQIDDLKRGSYLDKSDRYIEEPPPKPKDVPAERLPIDMIRFPLLQQDRKRALVCGRLTKNIADALASCVIEKTIMIPDPRQTFDDDDQLTARDQLLLSTLESHAILEDSSTRELLAAIISE